MISISSTAITPRAVLCLDLELDGIQTFSVLGTTVLETGKGVDASVL